MSLRPDGNDRRDNDSRDHYGHSHLHGVVDPPIFAYGQ